MAVACAVQPPDFSLGVSVSQRVEHREHGGGTYAGADQEHRVVCFVEDERAARRGDVELVADGQPSVQIAAGGAIVLALDRDAVVAGAGRPGQRVVPQQPTAAARPAGSAA